MGSNEKQTYTHIFYNTQWGDEAKENVDWQELQLMEGDEREKFINEWCNGEEPDRWSQFPQSVEVEVYHDVGQPYHHVVAYERRDYPEEHRYAGDAYNDGYPTNSSRHDTEREALDAAYELMETYSNE